MDYATHFAPGSTKPKVFAAQLLGDEGVEGYRHLPALLESCGTVDLGASALTKREVCLVGYGAQSIGKVLRSVGYDERDAFHRHLFDWLKALTESRHTDLVFMVTVALGHLGIPPEECRERLCSLLQSERRLNDWGAFTCRAVAFRALARADRRIAAEFVDSAACKEYIDSVTRLAAEYRAKYPQNQRLLTELADEASWLVEL